MAVKQSKVFRTSDGKEFESKATADRHERLKVAEEKYRSARNEWTRVLTQSQKTADGEDFDLSSMREYYFVNDLYSPPRLESVSFYVWSCDIDDLDRAIVRQQDKDGRWREYRIASLYRSENKAKVALVAALRAYLVDIQGHIEQLESQAGE